MRSKHVQGGGQKKRRETDEKKCRTSRQSSEAHLPTFQLGSRPCQPFCQPPQNPQAAHSRGTARAYRRTQRVYVHHRGQRPGAYHHISAYHRRHPKRVDQGQQMPVLTLTARRPRHVHSCQPQSRKTPARPSLRPNKCSRWRSTTKTTSGPSSLRKNRRVKKQCYTWATWTKP